MATKNIVPNADGEGQLGTSSKSWAQGHIDSITGTIATAAQGSITSLGNLTALTVDDITIDGSTISDGGDITIDAAGGIILDADSSGTITIKDNTVTAAFLYHYSTVQSGDFGIFAGAADKDIYLQGSSGGSTVNALHLDMSASGLATFAGNIKIPNDGTIGSVGTADGIKINSSGKIGINSSSTSLVYPLEVHGGNGDAIIFKDTTNSVTTWLGAFGGAAVAGALTSGDDFALYAGNAEKVRISSTGEMIYNSGGFIDFDGQSLQLNTQRNPNSGTFNDTNKSNAAIGLNGANGASEIIFKTAAANNTAATTKFTIKSDGNVEIASGSLQIANAGDGINFSATSDASGMSSEVLDDYEEGTYTPTLTGGSTAGSSPTGDGIYTLIGNLCYVSVRFSNVTVSGAAGAITISLPFAGKSTASGQTSADINTYNLGFTTSSMNRMNIVGSVMNGLQSVNGGVWVDWTITNSSAVYVNASATYIIN